MFNVIDDSFLTLTSDQIFELIRSNQLTLEQFQEWVDNRVDSAREDGAFYQSFYSI